MTHAERNKNRVDKIMNLIEKKGAEAGFNANSEETAAGRIIIESIVEILKPGLRISVTDETPQV